MFLLAVHIVIPIAIVAGVTAGAIGLYGMLAGWWNGEVAPPPIDDDDANGNGDGDRGEPGPAPVTGYVCDRTGVSADAARYHSPQPVIDDFRVLGFDVTDNLKSSQSKKEIKRAQRLFRELGLPGMAGASDKYIDAIVGGCTLLSLAAAMEMDAAGTWPGGVDQG